jgi:hypothetical protein
MDIDIAGKRLEGEDLLRIDHIYKLLDE